MYGQQSWYVCKLSKMQYQFDERWPFLSQSHKIQLLFSRKHYRDAVHYSEPLFGCQHIWDYIHLLQFISLISIPLNPISLIFTILAPMWQPRKKLMISWWNSKGNLLIGAPFFIHYLLILIEGFLSFFMMSSLLALGFLYKLAPYWKFNQKCVGFFLKYVLYFCYRLSMHHFCFGCRNSYYCFVPLKTY